MTKSELDKQLLARMPSHIEIRPLYLELAHQWVTKITPVRDGIAECPTIHDGFATPDEALQSGLKMVLRWEARHRKTWQPAP